MKRSVIAGLLLLVVAVTGLSQEKPLPPALAAMVSAEREFVKMAAERGVRESFLAYFADDGISFEPQPTKTKESILKRPAPASPPPVLVKWAPVYGDISQASDLGYNLGPMAIEDRSDKPRPTRHGVFFSIWKKQSDGSWKVALDLGVFTPSAVGPLDAPYQVAPQMPSQKSAAKLNVEAESAALLKVEQALFAAAKTGSAAQALKEHLSEHARIHRPGAMPVVGADALRRWLAEQTMTMTGEPIKAEVARSNDLGYAYGSYELHGQAAEKGYYTRVWKRDAKGEWRIVLDVTSPLPREQKQGER